MQCILSESSDEVTLSNNLKNLTNKYLSSDNISAKSVFQLIIPILVDQAFILGMSSISVAMISSTGAEAISAVNNIDAINNFVSGTIIAVATGGTVVVSQYFGSKNSGKVSKAIATTMSITFILAFIVSLLLFLFRYPLVTSLFKSESSTELNYSFTYLSGNCVSFCGFAMMQAVSSSLRGIGKSKQTLYLSLIMNLTNIFLCAVFIMGLHMSIIGLVLAGIISRYLGAACSFIYMTRFVTEIKLDKKELIKISVKMVKTIFAIAVPFAIEQIFFNGGKLIVQTFVSQLGMLATTTNGICTSIMCLFQIPGNALFLSIVTVVGICIGNKEIPEARKFIKSFIGLGVISSLIVCAVICALLPLLVKAYSAPASIIGNIYKITFLTCAFQVIFWSCSFVLPSGLRAAGDAKFSSFAAMLTMWFVRVVCGYLFGITFKMGIVGIWLAMNSEWAVRAVVFTLRFKGKKWYSKQII